MRRMRLLQLEAIRAMKKKEETCKTLHLWLSDDKKQLGGQRIHYTGIGVDTIRGSFYCPEAKRAKLVAALQELGAASSMTARKVAVARGKVLHCAICIPYIKFFAIWFSHVIGSENEQGWDQKVYLPSNAGEMCASIIGIIESRHVHGVPMWPYVPSSLLRAMTEGDMGGGRGRLHIVHDASHEGWGALIEWGGRRELVVSTFTEPEQSNAKVRRETLAGHLAFKAAYSSQISPGWRYYTAAIASGRWRLCARGATPRRPCRTSQSGSRGGEQGFGRRAISCTLLGNPWWRRESTTRLGGWLGRRLSRRVRPGCKPYCGRRRHRAAGSCPSTYSLRRSMLSRRCSSRFAEPAAEAVDALIVLDWDEFMPWVWREAPQGGLCIPTPGPSEGVHPKGHGRR